MEENRDAKVRSLYKALKLLDYFDAEHPQRGVSEIAELSGMHKSSVHNIFSTFELCDFVKKNEQTGKYSLHTKILELSHAYYYSNDFIKTLKSNMQKLCDEIGETMYIGSLSDINVVYIDSCCPPNAMPENIVGYKAPLYCTGLGKAMLAYRSETEIDAVIKAGLKPFTQTTITDGEALKKDLAEVVKRGYAIDDMEHEYGIRCVAFPIKSKSGECRMAVSIKAPSLRMTDENIADYAKKLSAVVSKMNNII